LCINTVFCVLMYQYPTGLFVCYLCKTQLHKSMLWRKWIVVNGAPGFYWQKGVDLVVFTQARKHYIVSLSPAVAIWKDGWVSIEIASLSEITWSTSCLCTNLYRVRVQRQLRGRILPTGETGSGPTWTGGSGRPRDQSGAGQPVEVIVIKLCFFVTDAEARKARVFVPVMIV
jgi:hypothetical protein